MHCEPCAFGIGVEGRGEEVADFCVVAVDPGDFFGSHYAEVEERAVEGEQRQSLESEE